MATITRAGFRGQGKTVHDAGATGEGTGHAAIDNGNGQNLKQVSGLPEKPAGKGQGCSFGALVEAVKNESRMVATCWHPKPTENVISRNDCDVRVLTGEAAYQLSSGAIIRL